MSAHCHCTETCSAKTQQKEILLLRELGTGTDHSSDRVPGLVPGLVLSLVLSLEMTVPRLFEEEAAGPEAYYYLILNLRLQAVIPDTCCCCSDSVGTGSRHNTAGTGKGRYQARLCGWCRLRGAILARKEE